VETLLEHPDVAKYVAWKPEKARVCDPAGGAPDSSGEQE